MTLNQNVRALAPKAVLKEEEMVGSALAAVGSVRGVWARRSFCRWRGMRDGGGCGT